MAKDDNNGSAQNEWRARLLATVLLTLIGLCLLYELAALLPGFSDNPLLGEAIAISLMGVMAVCLWLLRRGRAALATQIFLVVLFGTGAAGVAGYGGVLSSNWVIFPVVLICAGMLAGWRSVLVYGGLSSLVLVGLLINHQFGLTGLPLYRQHPLPAGLVVLFCLVLGTIFMAHALRRLELARLERAAFERQRMEASRLEAVGQLAGGIAHDFNNLMMVVMGNADLLAGTPALDAQGRKQVAQIQQVVQRAAELTRQLLAFARRQVLKPRRLDLNQVVTGIQELLRRLIREDIQLEIHAAPDLPAVRADPAQLEQVLVNLVINAREAMPDGGRLIVETGTADLDEEYRRRHAGVAPGRHVVLVVSDTGIGMSADTQDRIFEPFYSTRQNRGGTGLGLATVWGIVRQSGGHLRVYSEPGRGTTFKVYLPAITGRPEDLPARAAGESVSAGRGELVLVVDDDALVRGLNGEMLKRYNYRPLLAAGGHEALELAQKQTEPIALLVTDVIMPGMGGRELAARLQAGQTGMQVLYVSGYAENAIVHQGELDPGVHFLAKPYSPKQLAEKIREVLDQKSS